MKSAEQMKELSEQKELKRKEYWRKFHDEVDETHLKEIENLMEDSSAIYWKEISFNFEIGDATIKYLKDKGFKVERPVNVNGGPKFIIHW